MGLGRAFSRWCTILRCLALSDLYMLISAWGDVGEMWGR